MEANLACSWKNIKFSVLSAVLCLMMIVAFMPGEGFAYEKLKVPLTKLTASPEAELRGAADSFFVKVPVPDRWDIRSAHLHFSYVNSEALLSSRSKLSVRLNGQVLAQVTLQPRSPEGKVDLKIPPRLFLNKYNDLEFYVTQNYTTDCSDPSAPELWTNIELHESYLEIEYAMKPVPLRLSAIANFLFDPKIFGNNSVNIVMEDYSPNSMRLAAIAASGTALRFEYRPVNFTVSKELLSGSDNIVIGSDSFLWSFFQDMKGFREEDFTSLSGKLAIMHMPDDRGHALIYIGGDAKHDMMQNTQAFSAISYPLPDINSAYVNDVVIPAVSEYEGKNIVRENKSYTFKELGLTSRTFQGIYPGVAEVGFRLPTDAMVKENDNAELSLHLVYGAVMRTDSSLNIFLNDKFAGAIPLDDPKGGRYQGYRIQIPGGLLSAGYNRLVFEPVLTPLETGECLFIQTNNLVATLYDDSEIKIPSMRHWIEMPSLKAFATDGFPFTKWPDWRNTSILLAEKDGETAAAAINLIAMVTQKTGIEPSGIHFSYELSASHEEDLIVVGTHNRIPDAVLQSSPLASILHFPWDGHLQDASSTNIMEDPEPADRRNVKIDTKAVIGKDRLLVSEFESPFKLESTVLLITARDSQSLLEGSFSLWEPAVQSRLAQDMALVTPGVPDPKVYVQRASKSYYLGKVAGIDRLNYYLHTYFWGAVSLLVISILALALIIYKLLGRYRAKRTGDE